MLSQQTVLEPTQVKHVLGPTSWEPRPGTNGLGPMVWDLRPGAHVLGPTSWDPRPGNHVLGLTLWDPRSRTYALEHTPWDQQNISTYVDIHSTGRILSRPWSRQPNSVMSEIECAQLHGELFRRRYSTRQSHGFFALAKHLYTLIAA